MTASGAEYNGFSHCAQGGEGGFLGATISHLHDLRTASRDGMQSMRGKKYGDPNVSYELALADEPCRQFISVFCEIFDKKELGHPKSRLDKLALALNPQFKAKVTFRFTATSIWFRKLVQITLPMPSWGTNANILLIFRRSFPVLALFSLK
jgi:hypothetical protein